MRFVLNLLLLSLQTHYIKTFLPYLILLFVLPLSSLAQWTLKGKITDKSQKSPVVGVTVMTTGGKVAISDTLGKYAIVVKEKDSIYFSYLGKATLKYPISTLEDPIQFNYSLHVTTSYLQPVTVYGRTYKQDSLQNRLDYMKVFNYKKPNPFANITLPQAGLNQAVGMDLDAIIGLFQFRKNRRMAAFQKRLLAEEEEKYVNHRFNKAIIKKLTGLSGPTLDKFMTLYRPPYELTTMANDLELYQYVLNAFKKAKALGQI